MDLSNIIFFVRIISVDYPDSVIKAKFLNILCLYFSSVFSQDEKIELGIKKESIGCPQRRKLRTRIKKRRLLVIFKHLRYNNFDCFAIGKLTFYLNLIVLLSLSFIVVTLLILNYLQIDNALLQTFYWGSLNTVKLFINKLNMLKIRFPSSNQKYLTIAKNQVLTRVPFKALSLG